MSSDNVIKYENEIVSKLQELIKIKSVEDKATAKEGAPFGDGPKEALDYVLNLCESLGMKTKNCDGYVGYAEVGSGEEMIGIISHVDVVPEGSGWTYPPYEARIVDGVMYGRGVGDDKGPAIASIYALKAIMDTNKDMSKRVRLIFGANEETGFECMRHYVATEEHPSIGFTPDGAFPGIHGEKGIMRVDLTADVAAATGTIKITSIKGGTATNSVPDRCVTVLKADETYLLNAKSDIENTAKMLNFDCELKIDELKGELYITTKGKSAHGSTPTEGVNAISRMFSILELSGLVDEYEFISEYNNIIGLQTDGKKMNLDLSDEFGALTLNVGTVDFDGNKVAFAIDMRYPITQDFDVINENLFNALMSTDYKVDISEHKGSIFFPKDHELVVNLLEAYREVTNDTTSEPITIGGGTYARAFKNIIAFGGEFPGVDGKFHQPDEFLPIESLMKQTQIYKIAIEKLLDL